MRFLRGLAVLAFVVHFASGCAYFSFFRKPEIRSVRVRILAIDFQGITLGFDVDVNNPYPVPLKTPRFNYGLAIQGNEFMKSGAATKIDLPAQRVGTVTLPVRLGYGELVRTYRAISEQPEVDYQLHGALQLSAMGRNYELPMSHRGRFPVLHLPQFSDVSVRVTDASLTRAGVIIEATMRNPNVFGVDVRNLGYAFKLGDVEIASLKAMTAGKLEAGQSGKLVLTGEVSAFDNLSQVIRGGLRPGQANITPTGSLVTPYGPVRLPR